MVFIIEILNCKSIIAIYCLQMKLKVRMCILLSTKMITSIDRQLNNTTFNSLNVVFLYLIFLQYSISILLLSNVIQRTQFPSSVITRYTLSSSPIAAP